MGDHKPPLLTRLLSRIPPVTRYAPKQREFKTDDPRLLRNHPLFEIIKAAVVKEVLACRPASIRIVEARIKAYVLASAPDAPFTKPQVHEMVSRELATFEFATAKRLAKKAGMGCFYVPH